MNWLQKACQQSEIQDAEHYFSIGHGDYNEEHGAEPDYVVWAYINGRVETSGVSEMDPETGSEIEGGGGTHGSIWGHHITERTYKGRYEPQTGRLSIVKPAGTEYREVPDVLMSELYRVFDIKEVKVF